MSLPRRVALLEWAAKNGAAVIEDDYDSEFRFAGRPVEPLHALDVTGRVIYVGSFSKTMLPGLRLGFLLAPSSIRIALESAKYVADWHAPLPQQAGLASFIESGQYARHVRRMRTVYEERHDHLADCLRRTFGDELHVVPAFAGLHLSATTNASNGAVDSIVRRARDNGVACHPLSMFAAGPIARAGLVLGYGAIALGQIEEGIRRLKNAFGVRALS
jgi:GntR family transcriptional regulator/MocR family aminotransferase